MARRHGIERERRKKIARERIGYLMNLADEAASLGNLNGATDYVKQARELGMKYTVRLTTEYKRKFCKYCYNYLRPMITSRSRTNSDKKRVEVKCLSCGRTMFFPYGREKKEKRRKKNEGR